MSLLAGDSGSSRSAELVSMGLLTIPPREEASMTVSKAKRRLEDDEQQTNGQRQGPEQSKQIEICPQSQRIVGSSCFTSTWWRGYSASQEKPEDQVVEN